MRYLVDTKGGPIVTFNARGTDDAKASVERRLAHLLQPGYSFRWRTSGHWHVGDVLDTTQRVVRRYSFRPYPIGAELRDQLTRGTLHRQR